MGLHIVTNTYEKIQSLQEQSSGQALLCVQKVMKIMVRYCQKDTLMLSVNDDSPPNGSLCRLRISSKSMSVGVTLAVR